MKLEAKVHVLNKASTDTSWTLIADKQRAKIAIVCGYFFLNIVFSGTTHHHLSSWVQARLIPSLAVLYMLSSWLPQAQTNGTKGLEERDGETKSLEGGAVKFPDLDSAVTDRRQDGENLRFPTLVKNKKRKITSSNVQEVPHMRELFRVWKIFRALLCGRMRVRHWCDRRWWKCVARLSGRGKRQQCNSPKMSSPLPL